MHCAQCLFIFTSALLLLLILLLVPLGVREGFFVEAQHELEAAQNILSTPSSAVVVSLISTSAIASARVCL